MILYNNVFSSGKTKDNIVKVTYAELAALGAAKKFDTKVIYQLTDYTISSTWAENKGVKLASLNHLYDILIAPLNNEYLNVNCAATMHDGETYFNEIELSQWKIFYVNTYTFSLPYFLNSPVNKGNPKGVIMRLTDECNNTCNFDFKNITFNGELIWGQQIPDGPHIDLTRTGIIYDNILDLSIENLTSDKTIIPPFQYNKIIGCLTCAYNQIPEALLNSTIINSEIHIIDASSIINLKAYNSTNVIINCNSSVLEEVEINKCTDTIINNGENASYSVMQFLTAKTVDIEAHPLNYKLIISPEENKTKIIS